MIWYYCRQCRSTFWSRKTTTWCPTCDTNGYVYIIEGGAA